MQFHRFLRRRVLSQLIVGLLFLTPLIVSANDEYAGKAVIRVSYQDRDQNLWPVRVQSIDGDESVIYREKTVLALEPGEHTLSLLVAVDTRFLGGVHGRVPVDSDQTVTYDFKADTVYVIAAHMDRSPRDMKIVVIEAGSVGEANQ